ELRRGVEGQEKGAGAIWGLGGVHSRTSGRAAAARGVGALRRHECADADAMVPPRARRIARRARPARADRRGAAPARADLPAAQRHRRTRTPWPSKYSVAELPSLPRRHAGRLSRAFCDAPRGCAMTADDFLVLEHRVVAALAITTSSTHRPRIAARPCTQGLPPPCLPWRCPWLCRW